MEATMSTVQRSLPMTAYWHESQIAVTFRSNEKLSSTTVAAHVIASLHLDRLEQFLTSNGITLTSFADKDLFRVPGHAGSSALKVSADNLETDVNSPSGK